MTDISVDSELDSLIDFDTPVQCEEILDNCTEDAVALFYFEHKRQVECKHRTQALCQSHTDFVMSKPFDPDPLRDGGSWYCSWCRIDARFLRMEPLK